MVEPTGATEAAASDPVAPPLSAATAPTTLEDALDPTRRRTTVWLLARLVIAAAVLFGATFGLQSRYDYTRGALFALSAALFASSTAGVLALIRSSRAAAALVVGIDLLLTTALVWLSGSAASAFTFLYGLLAVAGALVLGPRAALNVAGAAIGLYLALTWGVVSGRLGTPPDQALTPHLLDVAELATFMLSNVFGIGSVAALAANLARRVDTAGGQLEAAERRAEQLARRNEDIVRSIASGLLTTDDEGLVSLANPAAEAMFGAPEDGLRGLALESLIHPDVDSVREGFGHRLDGTRFPIGFRRSPLVDAEGEEVGSVWAFQDLTEINRLRREAEEAQRLAQLGRLAAGLAHEIRNPLTGISGSVEMVRDSAALEDDDARLLGIVLRETERLNDLVETMLRVGRPSVPSPVHADLGALCADVVGMARGEAEPLGVTLAEEYLGDPEAHLDPDQLQQVVWNLLRNAIQATPEGSSVLLSVDGTDVESISIRVTDEGTGLSAEAEEKLFDVFYSGRQQGIGLGLALVQQIVKEHGGDVRASNRDEGGAEFSVTLPRHARRQR